jgi:serine/threonine-protein kinase
VLKALTKNRDDRYQTADEMRRDIAAALAGRPVAAVLPPPAAATQQIQSTNVLPGTSTIPPVAGSHRGDRDGRGGRALGYALLGLAVLAVFVIAALIARSVFDGSGGADVAVPDVTGLTVPDAKAALEAEQLTLGTETPKASDTIPEGSIIDQSPESGTQVKEGGAVSVTVSTGADEAVVPSLVGLSLDEARQALNQAGLEMGQTDPVASDETRNTVVRVSPKEGETVPAGSKVDLKYASGNNKVPDVVGQDEATARNLLEQAGFTVATREEESADEPEGSVIRQTPAAKEPSRLGSTVTITIAKAPVETPTPTPPTETPLPTDSITPPPA